MRLLHATGDWKWTGPAEPMLHAAYGLRERGHEVDLVFPAAPGPDAAGIEPQARARGMAPALLLAAGQGFRPLRDRHDVRRLRALFGERRYQLIHAHHARDHLMALRAGCGAGKLVASWHGGEPIPSTPWTRWLFGPRGADGVVVLSERLAEAARKTLAGDRKRIVAVPGCVDTERFRPREPAAKLRGELGLEPDERVIGLVARLQPHRRVELLLSALARALREAPGLRLLVLGRGTHQAEVLSRPVEQLGLSSAVVHAGYRGNDYVDMLSLLDALVFLVPGSDGSCRAVLEAMAMEIPVIASRRGVLPDTVSCGETGRLVDEDPVALAQALIELWNEPARYRAWGKAARVRVLERHGIARHAESLERFYQTL